MGLDRQRVLAQEEWGGDVVDVGLDRRGPEEGVAEADKPLVGVDQHEGDLWVRLDVDGLERGDLHKVTSLPDVHGPGRSGLAR